MTPENERLEQKLDTVISLLRHLLALELAREGVPSQEIGKHLHLAKASVLKLFKGAKKERKNGR